MIGALLLSLLLLAAEPFWLAKPAAQWTDPELTQMLTNSPWAQMAVAPGPRVAPALVFLATAAPLQQAEQERARRAQLKRPSSEITEGDLAVEEYREWVEQNRQTQLILAILIPDAQAFSDQREVQRMEEQSVMRLGRRKIKMSGHFPPSSADPYLRLAFPRQVQPSDKALGFDLYLPGVSAPYRSVEFSVKDMVVGGKLLY